jgi:multicomponent Na+:H+ antiporter subunit D
VGALGAIAQDDMRRILSFQSVSHVGFMLMGLGLFTVFGLAATIFYVINHIVVNTALFLIAGRVEQLTGSANLRDTGGLLHRYPWLASGYGIAALSLAGIPPLAGFAAKLGLIQAAALEHSWLIMATALLASLLAIYVITKIWSGVFWGVNPEPEGDVSGRRWPLSAAATAAAVVGCLVITVAAGPIYRVAEEAAQELMDTGADSAYVQAVLR